MKTDCDLNGWVPGLPALDALALRERDVPRCATFTSATASRGWRARWGTPAASHRQAQAGVRPGAPAGETGDLFADAPGCQRPSRKAYDTVLTWELSTPGWPALRRPSWWRWTPKPPRSTKCGPRSWAFQLQRDPRRGRLHAADARRPRRARATAARRGAGAPQALAGKPRQGPSWASTSSTTATCSPTTASRCRAMPTTPCCRATCWKCTSRTTWPAWPSATWAAGHELRRPVRQGRAPDPVCPGGHRQGRRILLRRQRPDAGRAPGAVAAAAGRRASSAPSTRWKSPAARCSTASSATAC
jgi:hypothetical protein